MFATLASANNSAPVELNQEVKAISVQLLDVEEAKPVLESEVANSNKPGHLTLVSSTDPDFNTQLTNAESEESFGNRRGKGFYFKFPFQSIKNRISRHLVNQYNFYRNDKAAVVLLTVLTANTSVSWFVFSPSISSDQASIIVAINTMLYAYLGVNAPNWAQVLRSSKVLLQRSLRFRSLNSKFQDFISILATNTAYNIGYHSFIQAVLNWNDIERLLSFDVISLVLKFTAITVATSGVWDLVLNEWQENGRISANTRKKLSWGRSVIMVTLGNLMAIGVPDTLKGMLAFGAAGLEIYLLEANKEKIKALLTRVKNVKNLRPSFRFDRFFRNPFRSLNPIPLQQSSGTCEMLL
jgi:hypothetical protein